LVEFLIDENILGLDRYLDGMDIKYRKIGDKDCPAKGAKDSEVAKFAKTESLVVITNDDKLTKQCDALDVEYVFQDLRDLAKKVREYSDSH
jgi:predicted nuclease of predicted toxin-antitoxin system